MRIFLQPAFVLHSRPYRETSIIVDLMTYEHGRIAAVAKGIRQEKSALRPLLQPFTPLLISWQGQSELMTLLTAESNGQPDRLRGECLMSGLYLNELVMRILPKHDPHPNLYTIYSKTLVELRSGQLHLKTLRLFEKKLVENLGYGLQLEQDTRRDAFSEKYYYRFHSEEGFERCLEANNQPTIFWGKSLLSLAAEELNDEKSLQDAKRLMRLALAPLLGHQKINSRQLYTKPLHKIKLEETDTE
jgi:DNA repair protein RecO (recombination protein O)